MSKGHTHITTLYCTQFSELQRYVRVRFPRLSYDQIDDAVSDAFEVLVRQPALLDSALAKGGDTALIALLRVIAWRFARAQTRRACYSREVSGDALPQTAYQEPDQEFLAHCRVALNPALDEAVAEVSCANPALLRAALLERLIHPITDEEAARRYGVRREQVNKARACVARAMLN